MLGPDKRWYKKGRTNREILLDRCRTTGHFVANTFFRKPDIKKATHAAPGAGRIPRDGSPLDPGEFPELDLCVAPMRWRSAARDVESDTRANVRSDHFPLEVELG